MAKYQDISDLDISQFLSPIAENNLCGEDLSFSNEFHVIKKAKTQDDPLLDLGDWIVEPKQADWGFVSNAIKELLIEKTKDIRLLVWLSEAWGNLYGYVGVAHSLELTHGMLNQYWNEIHPHIDDHDLDQRLGILQGFVNQLPSLIKKVPVINSQPFYSLIDYENFLYQQNNRLKNPDADVAVSSDFELFNQSLKSMSQTIQLQNYQNFSHMVTQWERLKQVINDLMQLDAPSFASVDSQIEDISTSLRKIYKADIAVKEVISQPIHIEEQTTFVNTAVSGSSFQPTQQSHVQNREQAMLVLADIADYFKTNEPHSPISYMLQKTIKWSNMPLHEWLAQVIKDDNPLMSIHELLGVQKNSNEFNDE
ncbi:type VI secretion system protein TssA [Acinetobacter boissieri]|uniref:Type VI secretion system protein ImpA n=1 Tax=Acinetobacter boissieri TaxID=1219383 RepID=A0A1G6ILL9_9GAMM|nr:type VI secretion system protein TssA [Acinetobacter boissieri]SDC06656.1 type VI secretion system protein ImpA [Acinetobacter boissieri]